MRDVGDIGLGGMVPPADLLRPGRDTEHVFSDGRLLPGTRKSLRRIPAVRNAFSIASIYVQTALLFFVIVHFGPLIWLPAFLLMGRSHAQFASLMHESAHRLLFKNRLLNDFCGRWLIGYPVFTNTDAYRRVHMAHHREEFGPNEPDLALYANYPITSASLRRKLTRDVLGKTGWRLLGQQLRGMRSENTAVRTTIYKILSVQGMLLAVAIGSGYWWVYPLFWLAPYLTVWRLINRLRSIAEHGGLMASADRRVTSHSVTQHWGARFFLVPFNIGFHLAHHVDAGVPMRHLPRYHRMLIASGYINMGYQYPRYIDLWKALNRPL